MSTMTIELYDALIEAGVSQDAATKAAVAVSEGAGSSKRLDKADDRLDRIEKRLAEMSGRLLLIQWQIAAVLAGVASLIAKSFF